MVRQVNTPAPHLNNQNGQLRSSGRFSAFLCGLVTNLTNPKAWAFYFSLFTLVVKPDFPLWAKIFLCASMFFISLLWYGVISLVISEKRVQERFLRFQPILNGILGSLLMLLGGRLLLRN
jgi:threonine/homoserine/homoserine lactone efflux protein